MSFIVGNVETPAKVVFRYSSYLRTHEKKMHIDPIIDQKMKCQQFSISYNFFVEEVATFTINEPVILGQECLITVSLVNGKTAKVRIEKSSSWAIKSPEVQQFVDKCELVVVPCKAGNIPVPELLVWLDEKIIKLEGPKKIFISPLFKK